MKYLISTIFIAVLLFSYSFGLKGRGSESPELEIATGNSSMVTPNAQNSTVYGSVDPQQFVDFARKFTGTPYAYGSTNPAVGFDCSGFINHVARHFGFKVPRSSVDFTNLGTEIPLENARPGDVILFTGTDFSKKVVGHMGIVTSNEDQLEFIHSSSGKGKGVITSDLSGYYQTRFVKVIRIFPLAESSIA